MLLPLPRQESERKAVEVVRKCSGSAPSTSQARVQEEGGRGRQKRFLVVLPPLPRQESERKAVEVVRKGYGSAPATFQARVRAEGGRGRQKRFW